MSDYEKLKVRGSPRRIRPLADQRSAAFASSLRQAKEVRRQSSVVRVKAHCAVTLPRQRGRSCGPCHAVAFVTCRSLREGGFTLAEMLVSIAILALIVVFVAQLVKSAAIITTL